MTLADPLSSRIAGIWAPWRERALAVWFALPPVWRSERALLVCAAVVAFALLAAFHQVVHASVDRAEARDAALRRHQNVAAICGVERSAEQRALCQLTTPQTRIAVATR